MKWVYTFEEGSKDKNYLLGGKGANLAEMVNHQLPVPPGFIITTQACNEYLSNNRQFPAGLWEQVKRALNQLEKKTGRHFSMGKDWPLTVSVRSGAAISMPGMLETILNVGLTFRDISRLEELSGQKVFARDSFRRLITLFGRVAYNINVNSASSDIRNLLNEFKIQAGEPFPQDSHVQLHKAIKAVFDSWQSPKAMEYRRAFQVPDALGTAVVVQAMVFGNMDSQSGTGVVFSRNPATGEKQLFGEYLPCAQGEDLVSGTHTPKKIETLEQHIPQAYGKLNEICSQLEGIYQDMQDVEFTVERGKLWILQTRAAKRTPMAAIKVAVDMALEGVLSKSDAVRCVNPSLVSQVLSSRLEDASPDSAVTQGIASSPGAAVGRVALSREQVQVLTASGEPVIFVRESISPDDVPIMTTIAGIFTREGGATSHAAVVARGLNKPCVVGCGDLQIDFENNSLRINNSVIRQGDFIAIDGSTGLVFLGKRKLVKTDLQSFSELEQLLSWADEIVAGKPKVFINANTPAEVESAFASTTHIEAIGLCETEWMFYDIPYRTLFRDAILARSEQKQKDALQELKKRQTREFESLFTKAQGRLLMVRLLASPLDNFLPVKDTIVTELAELRQSENWNEVIGQKEQLLQAITTQQQVNPRFGVRGMRLYIVRPEVVRAQVGALFDGAYLAARNASVDVDIRIVLPMVSAAKEISVVAKIIQEVADGAMKRNGWNFSYKLGALIETPRAALTIEEIAPLVDFVCVGTDSLTETTLGYAREDGNSFIPVYTSQNIFPNPLTWFDSAGVGVLIQQAEQKLQRFRKAHPKFLFGVCGAHAHNMDALPLYSNLGLDYISVNPSHVLTVRLVLAQAKILTG